MGDGPECMITKFRADEYCSDDNPSRINRGEDGHRAIGKSRQKYKYVLAIDFAPP